MQGGKLDNAKPSNQHFEKMLCSFERAKKIKCLVARDVLFILSTVPLWRDGSLQERTFTK